MIHDFVLPAGGVDLRLELESFENQMICQALERTKGNKSQAAKLLGLNRTTLCEMLKRKKLGAWGDPNRRVFHPSMDIAEAIRRKAFDGRQDSLGRAVPSETVKAHLQQMHASGVKFLPLALCDGFSDQTGCPGHGGGKRDRS